jgi:predicted GNAT family acetyltransferase
MKMEIQTYENPLEFLHAAGGALETREAFNSLMLGVCGQAAEHPERFPGRSCWRSVRAGGDLVLAAIMTPPHKLILSGAGDDWDECTNLMAGSLAAEGWKVPGILAPAAPARTMVRNLSAACGKRHKLDQQLRLYELRAVGIPAPSRGRLRKASAADTELVVRWWYEARVEMFGRSDPEDARRTAGYRLQDGEIYLWEDGKPVSMAARTRPTKHGICVGMVFTPPESRKRGYATACVGELSRRLLAEGRDHCTLFADPENPTSNSIYRKIGYRPIGDFEEYGFLEGG